MASDQSHDSTVPSRERIEDHRLSRNAHMNMLKWQAGTFADFVDPEHAKEFHSSWPTWQIKHTDGRTWRGETLNWYSVSLTHRGYLTLGVSLTNGEDQGSPRRTTMRYRDMIVDNYLTAGGDLRTWRWYGAKYIINKLARAAITKTLSDESIQIAEGSRKAQFVQIKASHPKFEEFTSGNPLARGIMSLCRKYSAETGNAKVKEITFISDRSISTDDPPYHMLAELCRPGEDGYVS
ncbi:hypothetical protein F5Y16DRAFT_342973 [Xylariaceae sp. FL0255]|nr:hypothetical protein F5Y16DRAFT_342973 [Xylariaceae sp. FL0255]